MINGYDYTFLNFSRVHSFPTFTLSMQLFCEQIEINIALTIWFNTSSITTIPTIHWFRIQGLRKDKGCLRCHPWICLFSNLNPYLNRNSNGAFFDAVLEWQIFSYTSSEWSKRMCSFSSHLYHLANNELFKLSNHSMDGSQAKTTKKRGQMCNV